MLSAGDAEPGKYACGAEAALRLRPVCVLRLWISEGLTRSGILTFKGWNSIVHGGFPENVESRNLSRDNLGRGIGRKVPSVFAPCGGPSGTFETLLFGGRRKDRC